MADNTQAPFSTPKPVDAPPSRGGKDNPAVPYVKQAVGKGWHAMQAKDAKERTTHADQFRRAGKELGVKVKTATDRDTETGWYFKVENHPNSAG